MREPEVLTYFWPLVLIPAALCCLWNCSFRHVGLFPQSWRFLLDNTSKGLNCTNSDYNV